MYFELLHARLVAHIRERVRSGELTERGLARMTGISQPHIHNVLKGARAFSASMADQVLRNLRITALDLFDAQELQDAPSSGDPNNPYREVPLLQGRVGPGHLLPVFESPFHYYPFLASDLILVENPVLARVATDDRMLHLVQDGDLILLDRSEAKRRGPLPNSYYLVNRRNTGLIRKVRVGGEGIYLSSGNPAIPESVHYISLLDRNILEVVKAKVVWIGRYMEPFPIAG